jgi:hypothetical protein
MISDNDSTISPPLSPIHQQFSTPDNVQNKVNCVPVVSTKKLQNHLKPSSLPTAMDNNNVDVVGAVVASSKPVLEWSLTSKGKDLLIVGNNTFKCNRITTTRQYWRCDEAEYCKIWVHTTLDGTYINMNNEEHNHFCDPDRIIIKKLIGNIRERCKQEIGSMAIIYEQEIKKAKLTEAQLSRMPRYDQIRKCFIFFILFLMFSWGDQLLAQFIAR